MVARRRSTRPTREQILFGLRECFAHFLKSQDPIDPDADFVAFINRHGYDSDGLFFDGIYPIENHFSFQVTDDSWWKLFQLESKRDPQPVSFGQVADFIAEQLDITISFEPVVIFGRPCRPAGVFLGIEELVRQFDPKIERFGPSTPIQSRLRGLSLINYFKLLNSLTNDCSFKASDPLASGTIWRHAWDCFTFMFGIVSFACLAQGLAIFTPEVLKSFPFFLITGVISGALYFGWMVFVYYAGELLLVRRFVNPLPPGIKTFRDLAKLIADRMEANSNAVSPARQVAR
jgi:hypothetical protein